MAALASQALLAPNRPEGRWARGPSIRSALTCDDRVAAVLGFGLRQDERGVGEHREVAPAGEQLTLAGIGLWVRSFDAAYDQPGGDRVAGAFERGVGGFGDLRVGDPPHFVLVPDRLRVLDIDPPIGGGCPGRYSPWSEGISMSETRAFVEISRWIEAQRSPGHLG